MTSALKKLSLGAMALLAANWAQAQCSVGEIEISIEVSTDNYGYETYWELVPSGNGCGNGTLFSGGNNAVGCNGAGAQNQTPGGYGDNLTFTEGPWCLIEGNNYDIIFIDDWGDQGLDFRVMINGLPAYVFDDGDGLNSIHTFTASPPPPDNGGVTSVNSPAYVALGNVPVEARIRNTGSNAITSLELNWSVDNGPATTNTLSGLNIGPFESLDVVHPDAWVPAANGTYDLKVWISLVNGNTDPDPSDNEMTKSVIVGPGIPNIIDGYLQLSPIMQTVIVDGGDQVAVPRDLDFHPELTRYELWVINKETENSGGSTVTIWDAGKANQTSEWKTDGNAWHFMSLPTAIAFSNDNFNFGTTTGVYDANHNGGDPFTGPSLWSSDPLIYAQPSGGNGSHIDMLHEAPECQGMAHESGNAFWVFDGYNNDITYFDFVDDHGPGADFHGDAIIRRFPEAVVAKDPNDHIVSHLARDHRNDWLYVVDHGNDRVFRMDVTTGTETGIPSWGPWEPLVEYTEYTGLVQEDVVTTGLIEPSGIALIEDRMLVTDHANGDIIVYDIDATPVTELGRIQTGTPGIMGITIGPEGHIWYVNATTSEVVRLDALGLTVEELEGESTLNVYPNPTESWFTIASPNADLTNAQVRVIDATGKVMLVDRAFDRMTIDVSGLAAGMYFIEVQTTDGKLMQERLVIR